MAHEAHARQPEGSLPLSKEPALRELIKEAFAAARASGRADWEQMTVAVLKNRLLDRTKSSGRTFNEEDYGARSVTELVRRLPDLVALDETTKPPTVRLLRLDAGVGVETVDGRVRSDLWNAVVDYRSGIRYVWDGVRAVREDRLDSDERGRYPVLPTLTETEMDDWRERFVAEEVAIAGNDDGSAGKVEAWRRHRLGTESLPVVLRRRWNRYLKRAVFWHLCGWFENRAISPPDDIIVRPAQTARTAAAPVEPFDVEELRQMVQRCVDVMTADELRALSLPAAVILRART